MKNSQLTIFTDIILLTIAFIIFTYTLLEMKDTIHLKQKLLKKIFQNDNLNPIEKINLARNFCDKENEYESFFNYTFPGVKPGSYYKDLDVVVPKKACLQNDKECANIPEIKEQFMSVWDDRLLCLKRMNKSGDYKIVTSIENCPENYRQCGYYNLYMDKYCLKSEVKCPINYVRISYSRDINFSDTDFDYLKLGDDKYLVVSNNMTDSIIPIDFIVAEYTPCLQVERISYDPKFPPFPFINKLEQFGCDNGEGDDDLFTDDGFDERYKSIFTQYKTNFYFENDIQDKYQKLPNIKKWENDIKQARYHIFSRNYISLNFTCSNLDDFNEFKNTIESFKIIKYYQLVLALFNLFVICFFISLLSLLKIVKRWLHSFITFIKILFSAGFVIYLIHTSFDNIETTNYLHRYLDEDIINCVDTFVLISIMRYEVFNNIEVINLFNKYIYFFSICYGIVVAFQFIRLVYKVYIRIKNKKRRALARKELGNVDFVVPSNIEGNKLEKSVNDLYTGLLSIGDLSKE